VELFLVHDSRQSEIGNQQIRIILRGSEQEILWLQVSMYNTMVVEIGNSGESRSHQVGGIGFIVVTFSADAIKKLASKRKVGY
jgi:hypothetical protein